jgi:hypothetical protein
MNQTQKTLNQIMRQTRTRGMKTKILINGKKKNPLVKEHVGPMGEVETMEGGRGGKLVASLL